MSKSSARWKSYSFLLLNVVLWGFAFVFVKPSLEFTSPFRYLLYRFTLASLVSLPIAWYYLRRCRISLGQVLKIAGTEFIGSTFCLGLIYLGLKHTTALETNLIGSAGPVFVTLGGIWLLKEREERHEWLGLAIAFSGTLLIVAQPLIQSMGNLNTISLFGNTLVLGSVICNMFYIPLTKMVYRDVPKLLGTSIGFTAVAGTFLLLSLFETGGSLSTLWSLAQVELTLRPVQLAVIYMAIFGSIIGLAALLKGQESIEVSEATLFGYLSPLVYIPASYFLLQEAPSPVQLLGLGITLCGVWIAERRVRRTTARNVRKIRKVKPLPRHLARA